MTTKLVVTWVVLGSLAALAAPPGPPPGRPPGGDRGEPGEFEDRRGEMREHLEREGRLRMVLGISEALGLNEAEALRLSEKLKGVEEKRRPLRQQMGEAMKALHAASEGDPAALAQVDANVQKVLDGRAQMATLDKELFATLAQGYSPQQRARLALALGRLHRDGMGGGGGGGRGGLRLGGRAGHGR